MFTNGATLEDNLWFGGLYQVVRVDSRMETGSFTQILTCVRMNNQQGSGTLVEAVKTSSRHFDEQVEKERRLEKLIKKGRTTISTGSIS